MLAILALLAVHPAPQSGVVSGLLRSQRRLFQRGIALALTVPFGSAPLVWVISHRQNVPSHHTTAPGWYVAYGAHDVGWGGGEGLSVI